jgi:heme/copper-type cytochrome/quinol oxidase subunit 2
MSAVTDFFDRASLFNIYEITVLLVLVCWMYVGRKEKWDGPELFGAVTIAIFWPAFAALAVIALLVNLELRK